MASVVPGPDELQTPTWRRVVDAAYVEVGIFRMYANWGDLRIGFFEWLMEKLNLGKSRRLLHLTEEELLHLQDQELRIKLTPAQADFLAICDNLANRDLKVFEEFKDYDQKLREATSVRYGHPTLAAYRRVDFSLDGNFWLICLESFRFSFKQPPLPLLLGGCSVFPVPKPTFDDRFWASDPRFNVNLLEMTLNPKQILPGDLQEIIMNFFPLASSFRLLIWGYVDILYANSDELQKDRKELCRSRRFPTSIFGLPWDMKVVKVTVKVIVSTGLPIPTCTEHSTTSDSPDEILGIHHSNPVLVVVGFDDSERNKHDPLSKTQQALISGTEYHFARQYRQINFCYIHRTTDGQGDFRFKSLICLSDDAATTCKSSSRSYLQG